MMPIISSRTLQNGKCIPVIGFGAGTAWFKRADQVHEFNHGLVNSTKAALNVGFRHLDLAEVYGTDDEIGKALKETGVPRDQIFITSKLITNIAHVKEATQSILQKVGISYLDLLLIHAPFLPPGTSVSQAWSEMEALVDAGVVTSIGVSNFRVEDLKDLLSYARIKPVVNQVEFHPYLQQPELHQFCKAHGIVMCGYSGLISLNKKVGGPVDTVVEVIAKERGLSPAQVLILWGIQKEVVVITTSSQEQRLREYLAAAAAAGSGDAAVGRVNLLSEEEMQSIDEAGSQLHFRQYWQEQFGFVPSA
ncbi:hypothetical protein CEUSTIGMA_g413.t1 [Chlamydomonas eustigma]|uniref:NADP-dependent oxidoreductase domain-containing protein n=1 Tax=Chlamydomonas eustigma TaxID=1157962 RepID=A0A250WQ56_9CHLO|nr:hypothetical protein CEUSTIGMA_g413.t1 [Chlamydomonas eustigma]|eukprot:GAX72958.1 hypothetical protein CEUSTIGMA_g413.t1 [Chlamydomonas eustigma]